MDEWNSCVWQRLAGEAGGQGGEYSGGCLLLMWGTQIRDNINRGYRNLLAGWAKVHPRHDKCRWRKDIEMSLGCHYENTGCFRKAAQLYSSLWELISPPCAGLIKDTITLDKEDRRPTRKWENLLLLLFSSACFGSWPKSVVCYYVTALQEMSHQDWANTRSDVRKRSQLHQTQPSTICGVLPGDCNTGTHIPSGEWKHRCTLPVEIKKWGQAGCQRHNPQREG